MRHVSVYSAALSAAIRFALSSEGSISGYYKAHITSVDQDEPVTLYSTSNSKKTKLKGEFWKHSWFPASLPCNNAPAGSWQPLRRSPLRRASWWTGAGTARHLRVRWLCTGRRGAPLTCWAWSAAASLQTGLHAAAVDRETRFTNTEQILTCSLPEWMLSQYWTWGSSGVPLGQLSWEGMHPQPLGQCPPCTGSP